MNQDIDSLLEKVRVGDCEKTVDPIYTVDFKDDKELSTWLNAEFNNLISTYTPFFEEMIRNAKHHALSMDLNRRGIRSTNSNRLIGSSNRTNFQINDAQDIIETKVSRNNRIKPKIDILPGNPNDPGDISAAREVEHLKEHLFYVNQIDKLRAKTDRYRFICGASYVGVEWNPDIGDFHPDYVAAKKKGEVIAFVNDDGETQYTKDGKKIVLDNVKIGDVEVNRKLSWNILPEYKDCWEEVDYYFEIKRKPIEQLKREYPNKKEQIEEHTSVEKISNTRSVSAVHNLQDAAFVYEICFFHRKTKFVPEGLKISFLNDLVLEKGELPYSHGKLPIVRLADLELDGFPLGIPSYSHILTIQKQKNNIDRMALRNIYLGANPKLVVDSGSDMKSINNDHSVIKVAPGHVPPQFINSNPISPQALDYAQNLVDAMSRISKSSVTRGEVPTGVTAASAITFLDEQEVISESDNIAKLDSFEEDLTRMIIAVAAEYYEPDDGRMMRIMGNNGIYSIKQLETANLNKAYDIRVKKGASVPESKAAQKANIVQVMQMTAADSPYSTEEWLQMLGIGADKRVTDLASAALNLADEENEQLLKGDGNPEVESYHDHYHHWKRHYARMQSPSYRSFDEANRQEFQAHVLDHEYEMQELAAKNPLFQQKLAQLDAYPLFLELDFTPASKEHQEEVVRGKSNRGEPLNDNEMIPTSIEEEKKGNKGEINV